MNYVIEALPVVLAIYAAIICAKRYAEDRRHYVKQVLLMAVISALLLITAQTSWYISTVILSTAAGTWFADKIWTIFNSITMLAFIMLAHGGSNNVEKSITTRN